VGWGNTKSIIEQRPGFQMRHASFQPTATSYDHRAFLACAQELVNGARHLHQNLSVSSRFPPWATVLDVQTLMYDVIDFLRQVLSDAALDAADGIDSAYFEGDRLRMAAAGERMESIVAMHADILDLHWMWASSADSADPAMADQLALKDLRELLTVWSVHTELLHSYASRQTADLSRNVYIPRWKVWIHEVIIGGASPDSIDAKYKAVELAYIRGDHLQRGQTSMLPPGRASFNTTAIFEVADRILALV